MNREPSYRLIECALRDIKPLIERYHPYAGSSNTAVHAYAVEEGGRFVAGFAWMPPIIGAAKSVEPSNPGGVLALSRMVAVPKTERSLKHISKPLRRIMFHMLNRDRWPVLVTYSDESLGHNGFVYQCSGWKKTSVSVARMLTDSNGKRVSSYSSGRTSVPEGCRIHYGVIQRWENRL